MLRAAIQLAILAREWAAMLRFRSSCVALLELLSCVTVISLFAVHPCPKPRDIQGDFNKGIFVRYLCTFAFL